MIMSIFMKLQSPLSTILFRGKILYIEKKIFHLNDVTRRNILCIAIQSFMLNENLVLFLHYEYLKLYVHTGKTRNIFFFYCVFSIVCLKAEECFPPD